MPKRALVDGAKKTCNMTTGRGQLNLRLGPLQEWVTAARKARTRLAVFRFQPVKEPGIIHLGLLPNY